ncbi:hypothetical protein KR074_000900, partial [Drosophila pseudoananassae]
SQYLTATLTEMNNLSPKSPFPQIGLGAAGGFLTGYFLLKASKLVAVAAGGTILIIELALHAGVVKLDIVKIISQPSQDQGRAQRRVSNALSAEEAHLRNLHLREKACNLCATSGRLCVAFLGGFLLGFGWA